MGFFFTVFETIRFEKAKQPPGLDFPILAVMYVCMSEIFLTATGPEC